MAKFQVGDRVRIGPQNNLQAWTPKMIDRIGKIGIITSIDYVEDITGLHVAVDGYPDDMIDGGFIFLEKSIEKVE